MTDAIPRLGAVILTYNSTHDFSHCLAGLVTQRGADLRVIVVDNASRAENRTIMEGEFLEAVPSGVVVEAAQATPALLDEYTAVFVRNDNNTGYSAGNNIGARLAVGFGCEAVLIVNPDVQISNPDYLATLWSQMRTNPQCLVGSSRVVNLQGGDVHPLREIGFWEDVLWIRQYGPRRFRPKPYVCTPTGILPIEAEKLHGSCMMIRSSFLVETGYLDENVFLYSEEPILAARVRAANGRMFVFPSLKAIHAHVASTKGNSSHRMLQFIESRLYFYETYTDYGRIRMAALRTSYRLLGLLHRLKAKFSRANGYPICK